jgi:hypothetical protein
MSKRDREGDSWWTYQSKKGRRPGEPGESDPKPRPPLKHEHEGMTVEESDASDTLIQRIRRYWQK